MKEQTLLYHLALKSVKVNEKNMVFLVAQESDRLSTASEGRVTHSVLYHTYA